MDSYLRWAIWFEHGKKCVICGEPELFKNIQIDHLIPQAVFNDKKRFMQAEIEYQLKPGFTKNELENLIPAHSGCNRFKTDDLLPLPIISLHLNKNLVLKEKIQNKAEFYRKQYFSEFHATLPQSPQFEGTAANVNKLNLPVTFFGLDTGSFIQFDELDDLFDLKVIDDWLANLELENDKGQRVNVSTLREYKDAVLHDYYGMTNFAMKASNKYRNAIYILDAYKNAQPPLKSFISNPFYGLADFDLLPPPFSVGEEGYEEEVFVNSTSLSEVLQKLGRGVSILNLSSRDHTIWFSDFHDGRWMREIARYDFTGSGYEEILALRGYFCTGTMTFSSPIIFSRTSDDMNFVEVSLPSQFDAHKEYQA